MSRRPDVRSTKSFTDISPTAHVTASAEHPLTARLVARLGAAEREIRLDTEEY